MAYLLARPEAEWVVKNTRRGNLVSTPRRGHILGDGESVNETVSVCLITGGDALSGYSARAYPSMTELRGDGSMTGGTPTTIYPCEIGLDAYFPAGTIVLCHNVLCRVTAGQENTPQPSN